MIGLNSFSIGPPYIPTSVQTDVRTRTANISWRMPAVESNLENYTVVYYGLDLQTEPEVIEWLAGTSTTTTTADSLYYVVLENLEEGNTYNYSILPINCRGATSQSNLQFTTLSDGEFLS